MAISDTQKVDYLFKKLGYGVTKTDTLAFKRAFNESISSPLLLRGDKVWQQSSSVPGVKPSSTAGVVQIYDDSGNGTATVECTEDITSSDNRTWKTGLTDWVTTEFGATYLVKVYIANSSDAAPQTNGTQLLAAGSGNDDEWFFDYQSGVVHFIGTNLPTEIASGVTGKSVYVVGARYNGVFGVGTGAAGGALGDLTVTGTTISTSNNDNIILDPGGSGSVVISGAQIDNLADPTAAQDAATKAYVDTQISTNISSFTSDSIYEGNTNATADDTTGAEKISFTINATQVGEFVSTGLSLNQINPFSSATGKIVFNTVSAFTIPTGTNAQRPATGTTGDLRFNTELSELEFYNGSAWTKPGASVSRAETITPDGTSSSYDLTHEATAESIIVSLNGVVQHTNTYSVVTSSGTSAITFTQVPQTTDEINIRYLTLEVAFETAWREDLTNDPTSSTGGTTGDYWINSKGQFFILESAGWHVVSTDPITTVDVTTSTTSIFTFAKADYRSAEFLVQSVNGTDYQVNKVLLIHDDTTATMNNTQLVADGTSQFMTLSATIVGANVLLQGVGASGTSTITVRSTLIPV